MRRNIGHAPFLSFFVVCLRDCVKYGEVYLKEIPPVVEYRHRKIFILRRYGLWEK